MIFIMSIIIWAIGSFTFSVLVRAKGKQWISGIVALTLTAGLLYIIQWFSKHGGQNLQVIVISVMGVVVICTVSFIIFHTMMQKGYVGKQVNASYLEAIAALEKKLEEGPSFKEATNVSELEHSNSNLGKDYIVKSTSFEKTVRELFEKKRQEELANSSQAEVKTNETIIDFPAVKESVCDVVEEKYVKLAERAEKLEKSGQYKLAIRLYEECVKNAKNDEILIRAKEGVKRCGS